MKILVLLLPLRLVNWLSLKSRNSRRAAYKYQKAKVVRLA